MRRSILNEGIILTVVSIDSDEVSRQARKACVEQIVDVFMVLEFTFTEKEGCLL